MYWFIDTTSFPIFKCLTHCNSHLYEKLHYQIFWLYLLNTANNDDVMYITFAKSHHRFKKRLDKVSAGNICFVTYKVMIFLANYRYIENQDTVCENYTRGHTKLEKKF